MKQFSKNDFVTMPWKNGGGTTLQLYIDPSQADFNLRLSVATVSKDGPFSLFPTYERHLLILNGEGCNLKLQNGSVTLRPESSSFIFQGEEEIYCSLLGEQLQDFNVMIKRSWGKANVRRSDNELYVARTNTAFIYNIHSLILYQLEKGEEYQITSPSIIVEITSL